MTTPTQAQIEVARRAAGECLKSGGSLDECLSAALTAAAEVGSMIAHDTTTGTVTERMTTTLTAEVGDPYKDVPQHLWDMLANNKNATIERCAQVVENFEGTDDVLPRQIAAEIRALKDKP